MDSVTEQGITEIRDLIRARQTANQESFREAAAKIGVTSGGLSQLMTGSVNGVSVEVCIKLAYYLGMSVQPILRLAGHNDVADLWGELNLTDQTDPYVQELSQALDALSPEQKRVVIDNARAVASVLRKHGATVIGGEDATKPKKRLYHVRKRKPSP